MAANFANMTGGPPRGKFGNVVWLYETTDTQATMNTAGYFNGIGARGGKIGDEIIATVWTTAIPSGAAPADTDAITARVRFYIRALSASDVADVADGDAVTVTNTD